MGRDKSPIPNKMKRSTSKDYSPPPSAMQRVESLAAEDIPTANLDRNYSKEIWIKDSERIHDLETKINTAGKGAVRQRKKVVGRKIDIHTADMKLPKSQPKSKDEYKFLKSTLSENFLFSALDDKELKLLIDVMAKEKVKEGTTVIQQGDMGDFFYVVQEGTILFIINEVQNVGSCTAGGSFGELALLYDAPRAATCIADTDAILWKVDQSTFRYLLAKNADDEEKNLSSRLKKIPLFQGLGSSVLTRFANALTSVPFSAGDRIVNKGDVGEVFYLIEKGQVRIHDIGFGTETTDNILNAGEWFGERALLTGEPRAASATAKTDVVTLAMDKKTFEECIGSLEEVIQHEMKKDVLEALPIFAKSKLNQNDIDKLVHKMVEVKYKKGDYIAEINKVFTRQIVVIRHGKVSVYSESGEIHILRDGDAYGDKVIQDFRGTNSPDTVVADEDTEVYVLRKKDIETAIGDMSKLGKHGAYVDTTSNDDSISMEQIKKHRVLGQGAFGLVYLVSLKDEEGKGKKMPYALKMMNKRELISCKMVAGIIREKQILASLKHPFILPLITSLQDEEHLYLLLKLIQGGELFNVIHGDKRRKGLPNDASVFYTACVMDALGHFHHRLICYRDLKPENVLIDSDGYCIIVDLGFAKIVPNKTYTMCGTPEYLAPEIITSKGHDKAVDWWAFGVLVYECLVGKSPFYKVGIDQLTLFKNIVRVRYTCPSDKVSDDAKSLLAKLLEKKPSSRLGNLARGYADVKEHRWFKNMNFDKLLKKKYRAPWVPEVKDAFDSSHFEDIRPHSQGGRGKKRLTPSEQKQFESF